MTDLAFLGTGTMGLPMARNLLQAGFTVHAWNRTPDRAKPLADDGAQLFEDPRAAADGCPLMITMLSDADSVIEVAQAALRAGSSGASLQAALNDRLGAAADRVTLEATGMGLTLVETPRLSHDDSALAREGDLVCLRVWVRDGQAVTVATRQVLVEAQRCTPLEDFRPT